MGYRKLWVVEIATEKTREHWIPCSFTKLPFVNSDYYDAHKLKRALQVYLMKPGRRWYKKDFRVRNYIREER